MDPSLNWSIQIHNVCLKANRNLSVLRRVSNLNRSNLDLPYKITLRSVNNYSLIIYFHTLNQLDIVKRNKIQYNAVRLVTITLKNTSREKLEHELGWETCQERAYNLGLTLFHKIHLNATRPLIKNCMPSLNARAKKSDSENVYVEFPS